MVTEFGMSDRLGPMTFGKRHEQVFLGRDFGHERDYGENIATIIDEEVTKLVTDQHNRVRDLLIKYRPHMDAIVKVLLEKETLDRKEVDAIMAEVDRRIAAGLPPVEDPPNISPPPAISGGEILKTPPASEGVDVGPQDPDVKPEFKPKFA